jgi:hypothetical protein
MPDQLDTEPGTDPAPPPAPAPPEQAGTVVEPETLSARTRVGVWLSRLGRLLRHEWTLVCLGSLLVAGFFTWPTLAHPFSTMPQDLGDPPLQAWQVAWVGHALLHDPLNLWNANGFYPEKLTLAYSDSLLGYAPAGFLGNGFEWAVFRYNLLFVFAYALAFAGAYFLLRQLGSGRLGGVVAGLAFGFAPWRVAHDGHLNVLSTGGIALSLAMLARGHDWKLYRGVAGDSGERHFRPGWALAGWLVATWQISLGFGLGIPFGYFLACAGLVAAAGYVLSWLIRRRRPPFPRRLLIMDAAGVAILGVVTVLMALPYLRVAEHIVSARRTADNIDQFSVPFRGLFVAHGNNWLWGDKHAAIRDQVGGGESALLPGFFLICLAIAGTYYSVWRPYQRFLLALGTALSVILTLGTHFGDGDPGYLTLFRLLPGWDAMRTPGRLVVWTTLLLAALAAGFLTALTRLAAELKAGEGDGRRLAHPMLLSAGVSLLALVLLLPVVVEGKSKTEHPDVWTPPAAMHNLPGPALVMPPEGWLESNVLLWSADGFPQVANGSSGVTPDSQNETKEKTKSFPDAASVAYLRQIGVKTVLWDAAFGPGSAWGDVPFRPVDGLGITKEQIGNDLVFHLN